jgi:hypothetical protein
MKTVLLSRMLKRWMLAAATATALALAACGGGGGDVTAASVDAPAPGASPSPSPSPSPDLTPTPTLTLQPNMMATGTSHSCAILRDADAADGGPVVCWGENGSRGALGNNSTSRSDTPVTVTGITNAVALAVDNFNSCALLADGGVKCWGDNNAKQLGNSGVSSASRSRVPVSVDGITDAVAISLGNNFACALRRPESDTTANIMCWGESAKFQAGQDQSVSSVSFVVAPTRINMDAVSGAFKGLALSSGVNFSCLLSAQPTDKALCWGASDFAQLPATSAPGTQLASLHAVSTDTIALSAGNGMLCELKAGGQVVCRGVDQSGQLGHGRGSTLAEQVPGATFPVVGLSDAVAVSASSSNGLGACAVRETGAVVCWGSGNSGQLGNGSAVTSNVPVAVQGLQDAVAVSVARDHACALRETGAIMCWGKNGLLGSATTANSAIPIEVTGGAIFGK